MTATEQTVTLNFNGFKVMAADFFRRLKALPRPTDDQVAAGLKMLRIGYLDMVGSDSDLDRHQAIIVLQLADRKALELTGKVL
jgi:hypothetical protein